MSVILNGLMFEYLIYVLITPIAFVIIGWIAVYHLRQIDKQIEKDIEKYKPHRDNESESV